eukprot:TRINITY_DN74386_c0_g1_i1.p1 TRINITY_DN74386_c0_g1~~TRINITY_DN74386_c0_g1_i1.p1  ORF type:complete len:547 (+),score=92.36 TRINITY_DN74386_c0_g1_i1:62-1702(+)
MTDLEPAFEERPPLPDGVTGAAAPAEEAGAKDSNGRTWACVHCLKTFPTSSRYHRHLQTHTKLRLFTCTFPGCHKAYSRKTHLDRHASSHASVRPHVCDEPGCEQSFSTKQKLDHHKVTHRGLQCSICEERFRKKAKLGEHRRKKHGIIETPPAVPADAPKVPEELPEDLPELALPHTCGECDQSFGNFHELVKHRRTAHPRVHVCGECGKSFAQSSTLQQHQKRVHQEEVVACSYEGCTQTFSSMANWRVHERISHKGLRPYSCRDCGQTFGYKHVLKRHIAAVHSGQPKQLRCEARAAEPASSDTLAAEDSHVMQAGGSSGSRPAKAVRRKAAAATNNAPASAAAAAVSETWRESGDQLQSTEVVGLDNTTETSPLPGPAEGLNLYDVLGIPRDATADDIKSAYRHASLKYHPDRPGGSPAAFQRVGEANETLSDVEKRRVYDLRLKWQEDQAELHDSAAATASTRRRPAAKRPASSSVKAPREQKRKTVSKTAAAAPKAKSAATAARSSSPPVRPQKKKPAAGGRPMSREDVFDFLHGALRCV